MRVGVAGRGCWGRTLIVSADVESPAPACEAGAGLEWVSVEPPSPPPQLATANTTARTTIAEGARPIAQTVILALGTNEGTLSAVRLRRRRDAVKDESQAEA